MGCIFCIRYWPPVSYQCISLGPIPRLMIRSGTVFSCIRLYYCVQLTHSKDLTYLMALMGLWSYPELTCGFLAASMPVFPKFFGHILKKPYFVSLSSRIQSIFGLRRSTSSGYAASKNQEVNTPHQPSGKMKAVITDIEFQELVMGPDQVSMVASDGGCHDSQCNLKRKSDAGV